MEMWIPALFLNSHPIPAYSPVASFEWQFGLCCYFALGSGA